MQKHIVAFAVILVVPFLRTVATGQDPFNAKSNSESNAELDPFDSAASSPSASREVRLLAGKPDAEFSIEFSDATQESAQDLGSIRAGSSQLIEFKLINKLGFDIVFDKITSSCGCISGLPKDVILNPNVSIPVRVIVKIPDSEEKFEKVINLVDSKNSVAARVKLIGQAIPTIRMGVDWFVIPKSGRKTFETKVDFPFDKVDELKFRFNSPEIAGWRVIPETEQAGTLIFDVVVNENDGITDTIRLQVLSKKSDTLTEFPVKFIRGTKPATRPSKIIVKRNGDALVGRVMVQFEGLAEPGKLKDVELQGTAVSKLDGESFDFPISSRIIGGKELKNLADLKIEDQRIVNDPQQFDLSVKFVVGSEVLQAPISVMKGE